MGRRGGRRMPTAAPLELKIHRMPAGTSHFHNGAGIPCVPFRRERGRPARVRRTSCPTHKKIPGGTPGQSGQDGHAPVFNRSAFRRPLGGTPGGSGQDAHAPVPYYWRGGIGEFVAVVVHGQRLAFAEVAAMSMRETGVSSRRVMACFSGRRARLHHPLFCPAGAGMRRKPVNRGSGSPSCRRAHCRNLSARRAGGPARP